MRCQLTLAYDGRPFNGWQSQPGGHTVQDHLQAALATIAKQPIACHGSGRTDAGVHALGQVAHFDPPAACRMTPANWQAALNARLPATIRVMTCDEAPAAFHARFSATGKTYHYDIHSAPVLPPLLAGLAWHQPQPLDPAALTVALRCFQGTHDFHAFCAYRGNESPETDYRRTVTQAAWTPLPNGCRLVFSADGFLYKMVRMLAGAAVRVAAGRMRCDALLALLDQPPGLPHGKCQHCAPAAGLYLKAVHYTQTRE